MNAFIKSIFLFASDGDYRVVNFHAGLNIITGDSKTGKTAILEIIDYCFCSSTSSIPKGVITDFTEIYCLILSVQEKYLVIAREKSTVTQRNKGYFSVEYNDSFLKDFSLQYFLSRSSKPIKDVQFEIERHLGISVSNTEDDQLQKSNKASLRNFMPLLLQHQNLIANKHALFYRFDDMEKRKRTIEEFPIFMGWVDGKYYSIVRSLAEKKLRLAACRKINEKLKAQNANLQLPLADSISDYFATIGRKFISEGKSLEELLMIGKNLPTIDSSGFSSAEEVIRLHELTKKREEVAIKLTQITKQKQLLDDTLEEATSYGSAISDILAKQPSKLQHQEISCPLCNNPVPKITEKIQKIAESRQHLLLDLAKAGSYRTDNSSLYESLQVEEEEIKKEIRRLSTSIKRLEDMSADYREIKDSHAQAMFAKGKVETYIEQLSSEISSTQDIEIINLEKDIQQLENSLRSYDLDRKYASANKYLLTRMNNICNNLDFEDELKPVDLHFDLTNFSFYHKFNNSRISLSEMGSGANWLACHLSLFMALLSVICKAQEGHIIPLLVIDQPSQVYFPNQIAWTTENNEDENIRQVTNVFDVLANEIDNIYRETKIFPQVIVLEHADHLKLKSHEFESFVIKRWKKDGEKLI
jgi:hypothetical protein